METAVLSTIEQSLILLNKLVPDQATKIANMIKDFREKWDVEISKKEKRDDALLDCISIELHDISELFSTAITAAASQIKP